MEKTPGRGVKSGNECSGDLAYGVQLLLPFVAAGVDPLDFPAVAGLRKVPGDDDAADKIAPKASIEAFFI